MCSVNSLGDTFRPASRSATFIPASDSRFAAHPPVAPDPTTMASYVWLSGSLCIVRAPFELPVREAAVGSQSALARFRRPERARYPAFEVLEMLVARVFLLLVVAPVHQRVWIREMVHQFDLGSLRKLRERRLEARHGLAVDKRQA